MDKQVAHANFRTVNEILEGLGVTYWIIHGTLLGAIREGDFIAYDQDIDFGVYLPDEHEAIAKRMQEHGFGIWRLWGTPEHGYEQSFKRNGVKVDVFYFYDDSPTGLWMPSFCNFDAPRLIINDFERKAILPPVRHVFRGVQTFVPAQPEATIRAVYGEDWRTPKKDWLWWRDPKNIRPQEKG